MLHFEESTWEWVSVGVTILELRICHCLLSGHNSQTFHLQSILISSLLVFDILTKLWHKQALSHVKSQVEKNYKHCLGENISNGGF